jgi:acyl carrier protein
MVDLAQAVNDETASQVGRMAIPSRNEIRSRIVELLAEVLATDLPSLEMDISSQGGDLEIDSQQAEPILARLERDYDRKLPSVGDLDPEQFNSIEILTRFVEHKLWEPVSQRKRHKRLN